MPNALLSYGTHIFWIISDENWKSKQPLASQYSWGSCTRVLVVEGVNKLINTSLPHTYKVCKQWKDVDENGTIFFNLRKSDTPALAVGAYTFGNIASTFPYNIRSFRLQHNSTDGSHSWHRPHPMTNIPTSGIYPGKMPK